LTQREHADIRAMVENAKRKRQAEQDETHRKAAIKAARIWSQCKPALFHDYLLRKSILPFGARIDRYGNLVIPANDGEKITTLQFIRPDSQKFFLSGGKKFGSYYVIADNLNADKILICEGFATGATLHMQTRCVVVVAFDAGNLLPVAQAIRGTYRRAEIIVAADNDAWTPGNPGLTKARAAALAIGGKLLVPDFTGLDVSGKPSDWNDWYALQAAKNSEVAA
jgi:putative DNA primase/helicase